jgi:hypothetical protein
MCGIDMVINSVDIHCQYRGDIMKQLTDVELGYISGFIDGEGSLMIYHFKNNRGGMQMSQRIQITNTNKDVLEWIQTKIGGTIRERKRDSSNHKVAYYLEIARADDILEVLTTIQDTLQIKSRQAKLMIEFFNSRIHTKQLSKSLSSRSWQYTSGELCISDNIKLLNKRGLN